MQGVRNKIVKKILLNLYDLSAIINPHNYTKIIIRKTYFAVSSF